MLTPYEFFIVAGAAYRLTRFVVFDSLAGFNLESGSAMSRRLDVWAWTADGKERPGFGGWLRDKVGNLLVCPYCVGFHVSWLLLCFWVRVWPWDLGTLGWVTAFAVAGAQSMLNVIDRRLA